MALPGQDTSLFLNEGLDASSRILCETVEDVDGTYPIGVALAFQVLDRLNVRLPFSA